MNSLYYLKAIALSLVLSFFCFYGYGQPTDEKEHKDIVSIKKAIEENIKSPAQLGLLYKRLGDTYQSLYGFNIYSLEAYQTSLGYFKEAGDSANYYSAKMDVGWMYYFDNYTRKYAIENYESALGYYKRTHQLQKEIHTELAIIDAKKHQPPFDYSLIRQLLIIEKRCKANNFFFDLGYAHNLLAICYINHKHLILARKYLDLSQKYAIKANINWMISVNNFFLGRIEALSDNYETAIEYYLNAYESSGKAKDVAYAKDICNHLSIAYTKTGDYQKANEFYQQTLLYSNQYYESEQTMTIRLEELNSQYKNLQLQNQLTEQENRQARLQNILLIVFIIFLILAVIALYIGRKQQNTITRQKDIILTQKIKNLELKSLEALIQGQENERARIARDLHDSLGIQLTQIKFFVESRHKPFTTKERATLNQIIDDACKEIRLISHNLHPTALSKYGLEIALEDLINKLPSTKKIKICLEKYGSLPRLSQEAIALIYRVIQELINNAMKHANACKISVQLLANQENLLISVEDDGIGFNIDLQPRGSGISNVTSRIEYLSGQVLWQNHMPASTGTSVMISIPMVKIAS
ncbi:sensor histidine kinase [Emticicia sp. BO119]|uniref:tetratricopeptide repeat-containing sensor histidine kinase n=1 Tax=Emticicia sp. BO119 TaxID=2757768 RepID=UPI0015F02854|nr:sensor histidine kinase [Emticicia sp. BO119]MBA4848865.1 sensor histidine kinase [Emticicia sp. BO119]